MSKNKMHVSLRNNESGGDPGDGFEENVMMSPKISNQETKETLKLKERFDSEIREANSSFGYQMLKLQIGNYIIGKGAFGKVELATHVLTGEKVAVKILEKQRLHKKADFERVSREIHILKTVRHPNIVQLYEVIETQSQICLVMELCTGGDLFDYISKRKRLEEKEAASLFSQLISSIEYLHKKNIVHRDLKLENLLIHNDKLKIIDFGLSNLFLPEELMKSHCGSLCYAAPEMIDGKPYKGIGVDLWSCGVILFTSLCGYLPFEESNVLKLSIRIKAGEYKLDPRISEEARALIGRLLSLEPELRGSPETIKRDPFFTKHNIIFEEEKIKKAEKFAVNQRILSKLEVFGFDIAQTKFEIENNQHSGATTCYYLLEKKYKLLPEVQESELSQSFDQGKLVQPIRSRPGSTLPPIIENENFREPSLILSRNTPSPHQRMKINPLQNPMKNYLEQKGPYEEKRQGYQRKNLRLPDAGDLIKNVLNYTQNIGQTSNGKKLCSGKNKSPIQRVNNSRVKMNQINRVSINASTSKKDINQSFNNVKEALNPKRSPSEAKNRAISDSRRFQSPQKVILQRKENKLILPEQKFSVMDKMNSTSLSNSQKKNTPSNEPGNHFIRRCFTPASRNPSPNKLVTESHLSHYYPKLPKMKSKLDTSLDEKLSHVDNLGGNPGIRLNSEPREPTYSGKDFNRLLKDRLPKNPNNNKLLGKKVK